MSEPVATAELAEALRELRLAVTTCVLTADWPMPEFRGPLESARSLLARYDAQQSEATKPVLSEVEQAAAKAIEAYNASNGDGDDACDYAMFTLREALRKRGAL